MLPPPPPSLSRPAEEPTGVQGALQDFQVWVARESGRGVPPWNPWRPVARALEKDMPGATVVVWGDLPPLETKTQEVLRLTVAWMIANRFHVRAQAALNAAPPAIATGSWLASHPGGNPIPSLLPLGWRRWE
jgi:hypothetical protein